MPITTPQPVSTAAPSRLHLATTGAAHGLMAWPLVTFVLGIVPVVLVLTQRQYPWYPGALVALALSVYGCVCWLVVAALAAVAAATGTPQRARRRAWITASAATAFLTLTGPLLYPLVFFFAA